MARNLLMNQRPEFVGKSFKHDSMLIRSEHHLVEFSFNIEAILCVVAKIMVRNLSTNQRRRFGERNHWSMIISQSGLRVT